MNQRLQNIIIVGSGKASLLHLNAYFRIREEQKFNLFVVAGSRIENEIRELVVKHPGLISLKTLSELKDFDKDPTIIDICTPTETHGEILRELVGVGFRSFIVEKPLVTDLNAITRIRKMNVRIRVMQNYLFSQVTRKAREWIGKYNLKPDAMFCFFCKNRKADTLQKRGFCDEIPPHVFTVEMPHQLDLAYHFLGNAHVVSASCREMEIGRKTFAGHGFGFINLEHPVSGNDPDKVSSFHFSCLSSANSIKRVIITDGHHKRIEVDYPTKKGIQYSSISLYQENKLLAYENFSNDDMMFFTLKYYTEHIFDMENEACDSTYLVIDALTRNSAPESGCECCRNLCQEYQITMPCQIKC